MGEETNLYARLGLSLDATSEDIRRAYREAALRLHPDTNVEAGATELFLGVQKAYDVLSNSSYREAYDSNLSENVKSPPKISIKVTHSVSSLQRIANPQLMYVLLELQHESSEQAEMTHPLNICLIIDSSTSMQGTTMDTVKSSAIELIRQLRSQDILSIVSFNDNSEVLLRATRNMDRHRAEMCIHMLKPGGGTEIFKGLEAGFAEALRYLSLNSANHVILITDGRTYGDEAACHILANQAVDEGIIINSLGIGSKWNDEFLDKLSLMTGGDCKYVTNAHEIQNYLRDKFAGLIKNYAERVVYNTTPAAGVTVNYGMRLQPEAAPLDTHFSIQLGNLPTGFNLVVLFELLIQDMHNADEQVTLLNGKIVMDIPSREIPRFTIPLRIERAVGRSFFVNPFPPRLMQAAANMTLYRMQERAQNDAAAGDLDSAFRTFQYLAMNLMAHGQQEMAQTVMNEATNLNTKRGLSEVGKKQIKYGTRALISPQNIPPY
jgi:Ca-activated chloride channel homolog